jgi:hypothetical protein
MLAAIAILSCNLRCPCTVLPGDATRPFADLVRRDVKAAHAVFAGTVVRLDPLGLDSLFMANARRPIVQPRRLKYMILVRESWKGRLGDSVSVLVDRPEWSCGRFLTVGESYVVFAYRGPEESPFDPLSIDACSRVARQAESESTRRALGRPRIRQP